jgi:subtilisin family serine protease
MHRRFLLASLLCVPALGAQEVIELPAARPSRTRERQALAEIARLHEFGFSQRNATIALSRDVSGAIMVDVFVRGTPGVEEKLEALGARVGIRVGEWLTAQVPIERVREIRTLAGVRAVELAPRLEYSTSTMTEIRASGLRRRVDRDEYSGATGQGTIVGMVDSGIDWRHGDFIDDITGESRILYLWDQFSAGSSGFAPPGTVAGMQFNYGFECRQAQMGRNGSCPSRDTDGHGTHVAGIAAGDGSGFHRGTQPTYDYPGVAPEADLIVVRTNLSGRGVVDGVAYIFARAEQLGKAAVVNLSLGTGFGPHDGTQALSVIMDELSGPGRIIVAAAGNEGSNFGVVGSLHGEATVARGDSGIIEFLVEDYPRGSRSDDDLMLLQVFYSPQDTFTVTLQRPDGTRIDVGFNDTTSSLGTAGGVVAYNGTAAGDTIFGEFESSSSFPTSTTNYFTAFIGEWLDGATAPGVGTWRVILRKSSGSGSGLLDAYIPFVTIATEPFFTTGAANRRLVQSPADAERVIAVGGYHAFLSWRSFDGNDYQFNPAVLPVNELLFFSSPGPTRDGRLKPEITAPGVAFSSMSRDANFGGVVELVSPDSAHVIEAGTSMATPHVTGTVALMLSVYKHLTPEQAIDALTRGARRDAFTNRTFTGEPNTSPNASWGFGKLDVAAAVGNVRAMLLAQGEGFNISQNPVRTSPVVIRFAETPRRVDLYDFAGRRVRSFDPLDFDDATTLRWNLQGDGGGSVVNGVYLLVADLPSGMMRRKVFIVR